MASGDSNRKRGLKAEDTMNTSGLKPHIVYIYLFRTKVRLI